MKKVVIILVVMVCIAGMTLPAFCQDTGRKARPKAGPLVPKTAAGPGAGMPAAMRPNFGFVTGTISKIDTSDPANVKLEVKSDAKDQTHTIYTTPWTNVTKITDVSELKTGDAVRVMTRTDEDKEMAMNVMFGDIKKMPGPNPMLRPSFPPKDQESAKK